MKDMKILMLLDRFQPLFERFGIEYRIMRRILQVKLTMDGRRVPTIISQSSKSREENGKNKFFGSLWVYVLMGVILLPFVLMGNQFVFQMSIVFGIIMFMIMTSLISDFSSVLLDIRDKNILGSKPVNQRTINAAKTIHIFIYLFFLTLSLTGPSLLAALITHGFFFFLIFFAEIVLIDLLIIVLTAFIYFFILKFFDGEKLKDIINYVQIALSAGVAIGYQLVGRLFSLVDYNAVFTPKWYQFFIIPIWFGAPFEVILHHSRNGYFIIFTVLAILCPALAIMLYIKFMPAFERNLQKLANNQSKGKKAKRRLLNRISSIICSGKEERIFFRFASDMMKNERDFKLKVYPSIGFSLIFPYIFIINDLRTESLGSIASSQLYLCLYFTGIVIPTIIMMLKFSGRHKGSWIYKTIPIHDLQSVFSGALKAAIVKLFLPVFLLNSIVFTAFFGLRILPDLLAVVLNVLLYAVICFKLMRNALPFSEGYEAVQQNESILIFVLLLILGGLALVHLGVAFIPFAIYPYTAVLVLLNWFAWKKGLAVPWSEVSY
ncbi:hypothetical protein LRR81_20720 [Metabacillus sp. GX 13764]|uniref:hypothetical protein n=1 Tax=Metabacillus kandeliae TaxID=2900151 RepID=UPI001E34EB49|nr:hypothetical protein [Metabacillus kandeliae]MCD7036677.1 hypothetical protein [Metabacillus kandeliae]